MFRKVYGAETNMTLSICATFGWHGPMPTSLAKVDAVFVFHSDLRSF